MYTFTVNKVVLWRFVTGKKSRKWTLKEERDLIDAIAERLGRISERLQSEKRIRQNELQLAAVQERIGRELHDDLAQVIASVGIQA